MCQILNRILETCQGKEIFLRLARFLYCNVKTQINEATVAYYLP